MEVKLNKAAIEAIERILKRGNNAVVKRNKDGIVIQEQYQKNIYRTAQSAE